MKTEGVERHHTVTRRVFLTRAAVGAGAVAAGAVTLTALASSARAATASARSMSMAGMDMANMDMAGMDMQQTSPTTAAPQDSSGDAHANTSAGVMNMSGEFYKPVRPAPKPNPVVQLTSKQIDDFERTIACPCPCTLDVFTCRTTDFACGNSPAVHNDVQMMVAGGYSADEIMGQLTGTYGNVILMAPPKRGVNLIAWFAPFAALGAGAIVVSSMLRGWRQNAKAAAALSAAGASMRLPDSGATDEEMARLRAAMRDDAQ